MIQVQHAASRSQFLIETNWERNRDSLIQREREGIKIKEKDNDLVCAFSGRNFILKFDVLD